MSAGDYLVEPDAEIYHSSIDPYGELAFEANTFGYGNSPVQFVDALSEATSNSYKDFLRCERSTASNRTSVVQVLHRHMNANRAAAGCTGCVSSNGPH
jgi:hypothetical protein